MTRWGHGHSLAAGLLLGFALQPHTLWLLTIAFAAGLAAHRVRDLLRGLLERYRETERRVLAPRPTPKYRRTDAW